MKQSAFTIFFLLTHLHPFLQTTSQKHPTTLGIHFTLNDFSNSGLLGNKSKVDAGLSVSYLEGISNHLDWQLGVTGSFPDSLSYTTINSEKRLLLQSDLALRFRLFKQSQSLQPFFISGGGLSYRNPNFGTYILLGPGIEFNYRDVYFLLNAQYRIAVSNNLNNHYHYSIGIAGLLSKAKNKKLKSVPLVTPIAKDRDGDGLVDSLDVCPDQPGLARLNGCPDRDGDGITDNEDACPDIFGFKKYRGCPVPDKDNDGINDEEDSCPDVPGILKYKGCPIPDTDKDGINDEEDSCITEPGPKENKGCPKTVSQIVQKLDVAAKNIFFQTGSAELLPESFNSLDQIVVLLNENKTIQILIEGHTDNVGTKETNQALSENRAKSVLNYLVSKGIGKQRLTAIGFGMTRPIATNRTAEGRAKNRRVKLNVQEN